MRSYLLLALVTLLIADNMQAAIGYTVSPSAISNTYNGTITLQITGLTNTETVLVQKFLDANTNGVVDAGDWLWQQFPLTDGSASVFYDGGTAVTNFNVPGDTDGAVNGQIKVKLNQSADFAQKIAGKYLFVLSSPVGHFSPITNSFSVTNFPFAQKFTGNVVSNGTSTTVPNALVLFGTPDASGNLNFISGAVANNSGGYSIQAPPGTYMLVAVKSNFLASSTAAANLALGSGATINTDLNLIPTTQSISGKVVDANNSSVGIPGFLQPVQSQSGYFGGGVTDTDGNFTIGVNPDLWGLGHNPQALMLHGYLALQSNPHVNTFSGSVSGVTIALPKATALFYGSVKDPLGNPLTGVWIFAEDNTTHTYFGEGVTGANGNYVAGVLGGSSNWGLGIDNSLFFSNYIFSQGHQATISSGQAIPYNFTDLLATNHINGVVQFNGIPVNGVGVNISATINSVGYQPNTAHTDGNGHYSFNVANGTWNVGLNINGGSDSLDSILGSGNYQPPNDQNININNNNGTANFTILPSGSGLYQIVGYIVDNVGNPIVGVDVNADDGVGDVFSGTTDDSGYYSINVGNGDWDMYVDCGELNLLGYNCVSDDYVTVSGGDVEADFTVQSVGGGSYQVVNGGFETGDFTGWSLVDASGGTFVDDSGISPHSGNYFAFLGPVGALGYLSQTLTTVPGQSYVLSLWLNSPDGSTPNEFAVSWNGSTIFDQSDMPEIGWTNLQFTTTATGTTTILQFGFRDDPSFLGLDDVSVLPVSVSPQLTIIHSRTNVILTWPTNATGFILQSTTNLVSPAVWKTNSTAPFVIGGQNVETNPISGAQRFYRLIQ